MDAVEIIAACAQRQVDSFFFLLWQTFIVPLCALLKQDRWHKDNSWKLNLVKTCFSGLVASFVLCVFVFLFKCDPGEIKTDAELCNRFKTCCHWQNKVWNAWQMYWPHERKPPSVSMRQLLFPDWPKSGSSRCVETKEVVNPFFFCSPQSN